MLSESASYSKSYLEWCEIMNQVPNERDFIIFHAGYNFALCNVKNNGGNND